MKKQAEPTGAYNYWAKRATERRRRPYPDDLDDTFCALSALYLHDPASISEVTLAKSVKLLLATESAVGGPYRTWLTSSEKVDWQDIDLVVNANIAYFLSLISNPLPNLRHLIDQAIRANKLVSPYYPSAVPIVYFLARGYSGAHKNKLIKIIRGLLAGTGTAQDQALCLAALANLDALESDEPALKKLLAVQKNDGSWQAAAFCLDPSINGQPYYSGCPALATAFAIEALSYSKRFSTPQKRSASSSAANHHFQEAVVRLAAKECKRLPEDLQRTTVRALRKIAEGSNGAEIIDLAPLFNESLRKPLPEIQRNFLEKLSLANLYGWLAYTVYDDFIDEEGSPPLLPAANVALRNSVNLFSEALPGQASFRALVRDVFDTIDGANAWELAHCRFKRRNETLTIRRLPDYGDLSKLAERSLGHCLAPLAILCATDHEITSTAFQQTRLAFHHYLVARQLNDDAHDWQADLARGQATYVVTRLLRDIGTTPGKYATADLIGSAQRQFWRETLPSICKEIQAHVALGRQSIQDASIFASTNVLSELFEKTEQSVSDTLQKQAEAKSFLRHYSRDGA